MITENFRSNVRIKLDYLHIKQTIFPDVNELYKNAIRLLFKAENAFETINILDAYKFLTNHYEKVRKAMSDSKWVALDSAHFAIGRVSLKRKTNNNLIYITNYLSKKPQVFYVSKNEFKQEPYVRQKGKKNPIYDSIYNNGEYYLFKKGSSENYKDAIAKYSTGRDGELFFVRIELLNGNIIDSNQLVGDFIKKVEMVEILELSLANFIISMSLFRRF